MKLCIFLLLILYILNAESLSRPTNLRVISQTGNGFQIQWDYNEPSSGVTDYIIRYKRYEHNAYRDGAPWTQVISGANPYTVSPIHLGHTYDVQVKARNRDSLTNTIIQESDWSNLIEVTLSNGENNQNQPSSYSSGSGSSNVPVPTEITVNVNGPKSLSLRWRMSDMRSGDRFLITLTPEGMSSGDFERTIRAESNSVNVGNLNPGSSYRIRIRTRRNGQDSPLSHTIIVRMPREEDHVVLSNLFIMPDPSVVGRVNLTWQIPEHSKRHVSGFLVRYSTEETDPVETWKSRYISGQTPSIILDNLHPDTEYYLKVQAQLTSGQNSDTSVFRFRTPKPNPIDQVQLFYEGDRSIRLDWSLTSAVNPADVAGYHVLLSQNPNLPEEQWRTIPVGGRDSTMTMDDHITRSGLFWVKIHVRKNDGTIWKSPSVFRFQAERPQTHQVNVRQAVKYRYKGNGNVRIRWTYPETYDTENIQIVRLFYSPDKTAPLQEWALKEVRGNNPRSIVLSGLHPNRLYFLRVMPITHDGSYLDPSDHRETIYKINTQVRTRDDVAAEVDYDQAQGDEGVADSSEGTEYSSQLCLRQCRPGRPGICGSGEKCIPSSQGARTGWCISDTLAQSVRDTNV